MKLKWLGTAGFQVDTGAHVFLIDPYLSRNARAVPIQTMKPSEISDAKQIFISHGHWDHIHDVPEIMQHNPCSVYCSNTSARILKRKGADSLRIHPVKKDGMKFYFKDYQAQAFFSRHIMFDLPLMARTLWNIGASGPRLLWMHMGYPKGQVISWRFTIGKYTVHHFGSAGCRREELERYADYRTDLLLVPVQGHTNICDIALQYVLALKPAMVIAHHHDHFYPPISSVIDISPFIDKVRKQCHGTEIRMLEINETIDL